MGNYRLMTIKSVGDFIVLPTEILYHAVQILLGLGCGAATVKMEM